MKKIKSLEKEIGLIMNHYHFDVYNKQLYIKNCAKAIVKVVLEMVEQQELDMDLVPEYDKLSIADTVTFNTKQEIKSRILGEGE